MSNPAEVRQVAIDHHDAMAATFENFYENLKRDRFSTAFTYGRAKLDRMVDEMFDSLPRGGDFLDIGCGTGEHLARAQACGLHATGLEPARSMLEVARRNVPSARIEQGVATDLPFGDDEFDGLIQIEVLRYLHADDIRLAMTEARRVLRPGGIALFTLVNRWALDGFYIRNRIRQWRKGSEFDNVNPFCEFFSPGQAERAMRAAGFTDVRTEGRLLAPLRLAYKASPGLGKLLARGLERLDDKIHRWSWTRPFAGHLIVIGKAGS